MVGAVSSPGFAALHGLWCRFVINRSSDQALIWTTATSWCGYRTSLNFRARLILFAYY
jgi:hypothetical protein